jgi:phosphate transport system substrate-binding protein
LLFAGWVERWPTSTGDLFMKLMIFAAVIAVNLAAMSAAVALDPSLPAYQVVNGISGQLKSVGSDTLNIEMMLWARGFKDLYPGVNIEIESKGSATAPPALLQGVSQFAPMSRPMTAEEIDAFVKKYGYTAFGFRVAVDALAVYVHKDNPIQCLTLQQLNRIFSSTYKVAGGGNIKTWGEIGLADEWATKPISLYGRNSISGTYEFFREIALNKYGGGKCYDTSAEATYSGNYPIARYLCIYLNKKPNEQLDTLRSEFVKYILSEDGQTQTEKGGFYPITNPIREEDLKKLGISGLAN